MQREKRKIEVLRRTGNIRTDKYGVFKIDPYTGRWSSFPSERGIRSLASLIHSTNGEFEFEVSPEVLSDVGHYNAYLKLSRGSKVSKDKLQKKYLTY